jgi:hypothetical protein
MAIADTGASGHYIRPQDPHMSNGTTQDRITVGLPNGATLQSSPNNCILDTPQLPEDARKAHLILGLTHSSLVSIGTLCDAGCKATFDRNNVVITNNDDVVLTGPRDPRTGLWKLPLTPTPTTIPEIPTTLQCANVLQLQTGIRRMVKYLHAAAFSPVKSTWIADVVKGYYTSWPGLTPSALQKYYPQTMATAKGHLDQSRHNLRSTKTKTKHDHPTIEIIETQEPNNQITHQAFVTIEETGKVYNYQTGAFAIISSNGHKYMLIMYHYDTNAILVEPLKKTQHGNEILRGYQKLYTHLANRGFKPTTHWLDNEASTTLKEYSKSEQVDYQLVPPQVHRPNAAERAIRTWKNHLISGICSTDTNFPMHLWDRILEQATITLNFLQPARRTPTCRPTKC